MIYKVDFEGQACKQIKEKAESYQYDLKSVLKGIGLLIADMWLPGDSKPQINTWEGLFEKVQEDYSYKDTIVENDFICSISNDDGISIIIEIADETIVDFKDIKSSILQVRDFLLANKWSGAIPDFLPIEQKEIRNMMNETERSIPFKCLHEAFFECAYRFPDKTALEWLSLDEKWETLSYEALKIKVLQTASMLKQEGVHTRDKVAIVLPKGENQIIAVLAILSIGATYVPIGIHQPLDRKKKIFEAGNISYALTDRDHINTLDGADTLRSFLIENSFRYVVMPETEIVKDIDSIAYIIFTSGTTGIPKGVMITHKAAYNTRGYLGPIIWEGFFPEISNNENSKGYLFHPTIQTVDGEANYDCYINTVYSNSLASEIKKTERYIKRQENVASKMQQQILNIRCSQELLSKLNFSLKCKKEYHPLLLEELLDLRTESEIENIFDNFSQEYIQYSVEMRKKYWHKQYYSI